MDETRWHLARRPLRCEVGRCGAPIARGEVYRVMGKDYAYCATCACSALAPRLQVVPLEDGSERLVWDGGEGVPIALGCLTLPAATPNPRPVQPTLLEFARVAPMSRLGQAAATNIDDWRRRASGERVNG